MFVCLLTEYKKPQQSCKPINPHCSRIYKRFCPEDKQMLPLRANKQQTQKRPACQWLELTALSPDVERAVHSGATA